ncbi:MAG: hypothetical protein ACFE0P_15275 [Oceanicaulis sp.]
MLAALLAAFGVYAGGQTGPLVQTEAYQIERAEGEWCSQTARIIVRERSSNARLSSIPDPIRRPVEQILRFECPAHQQIVVIGPPPASRYLTTRYSAIIVTDAANFTHIAAHRPEYAVIEAGPSGDLTLHAPEISCTGALRRAREQDMLDPHAHYLERNPVTGRTHPRSVIDATRPEYYQLESGCTDRSFTIFAMDREPRVRVEYVRAFPSARNGQLMGRGRGGVLRPLDATSLDDALAQARTAYIAALDDEGSPYVTEYERDHSSMVMAEFRGHVGRSPMTRVRGLTVFDSGWFKVVDQDGEHVFRPRPGARYSDIERIGEAIIFTENPGQSGSRTVIVAPYPYGTTAAGSMMNAFLGFDANDFIRSDYHMRQVVVCEHSEGLMRNTSFVSYHGALSLYEQLPTSCAFRSERAVREFLGHFESEGQAGNPDRRSMLTRMTGGGQITRNDFPCGDLPEFTIRGGVLRLRTEPCDEPSEDVSELTRPLTVTEEYLQRVFYSYRSDGEL